MTAKKRVSAKPSKKTTESQIPKKKKKTAPETIPEPTKLTRNGRLKVLSAEDRLILRRSEALETTRELERVHLAKFWYDEQERSKDHDGIISKVLSIHANKLTGRLERLEREIENCQLE